MSDARDERSRATARSGAIALASGAVLNMTRMIPIALSDGFSDVSLPPFDVEALAIAGRLDGWYISHIMAMASVPLAAYGFFAVYVQVRDSAAPATAERTTLAGVFTIVSGLMLYLVAAVLDGIALGKAATNYAEASASELESAGVALMTVHETAASFGGHFMAFTLVGTGILASGLLLAGRGRVHPSAGIAIGIAGLLGWITGILDLTFAERFPLLLATVGLMMAWWLSLAIVTNKNASAQATG